MEDTDYREVWSIISIEYTDEMEECKQNIYRRYR